MNVFYQDLVPLFAEGSTNSSSLPVYILQQLTYAQLKAAFDVHILAVEAAGNLSAATLQTAFETLLNNGTITLEKTALHIRPVNAEEILQPILLPVQHSDLLNLDIDQTGTHFFLNRPASSYDPITGADVSSGGGDGGGSSNNNNNNNNNNNG